MALSKNLCRMLTRYFKSTHHEAESESVFAPLQTRLSRDGQALFPAPAPSPSPSHTVSVRLVVNGRNGIACRRVSALWAARGYPSIFMGKMGGPLLAEELAWSRSILGLARHNLHLPAKLLTCPSRCGDGMKRKGRTSTGIPTHGSLRNYSSSGFSSRKKLRGWLDRFHRGPASAAPWEELSLDHHRSVPLAGNALGLTHVLESPLHLFRIPPDRLGALWESLVPSTAPC